MQPAGHASGGNRGQPIGIGVENAHHLRPLDGPVALAARRQRRIGHPADERTDLIPAHRHRHRTEAAEDLHRAGGESPISSSRLAQRAIRRRLVGRHPPPGRETCPACVRAPGGPADQREEDGAVGPFQQRQEDRRRLEGVRLRGGLLESRRAGRRARRSRWAARPGSGARRASRRASRRRLTLPVGLSLRRVFGLLGKS